MFADGFAFVRTDGQGQLANEADPPHTPGRLGGEKGAHRLPCTAEEAGGQGVPGQVEGWGALEVDQPPGDVPGARGSETVEEAREPPAPWRVGLVKLPQLS